MSLTRHLHGLCGDVRAERANDRMAAQIFANDRREIFAELIRDFKKMYYSIAPQSFLDRSILLTEAPVSSATFRAQAIIPYIAENLGEHALVNDILLDIGALNWRHWNRTLSPSPMGDLHGFFRLAGGAYKKTQTNMRLFIDERIEMFCNEAGALLKNLPFNQQHFLMTHKMWSINKKYAKPSFHAAAGNLSVALPFAQEEADLINRVANVFCSHIEGREDLWKDYWSFLMGRRRSDPQMEVFERLTFMQTHFKTLSHVLSIPPVEQTTYDDISGEAQYKDKVVTYGTGEGRGIYRRSRLDVFNIGNHEIGHHILKSGFIDEHASPGMRARVSFNEATYTAPELHFGAYQEQYVERFCDTLAAVMFVKMCRMFNVDPDAMIRRANYQLVDEGACKRLLSDQEIAERDFITKFRTADNYARGADGRRVELTYAFD